MFLKTIVEFSSKLYLKKVAIFILLKLYGQLQVLSINVDFAIPNNMKDYQIEL